MNLGGGWERSGHYNLDDTPSQNLLHSSPSEAQQYLLDLNAGPALSYKADSGSESSEDEADMGYTQEPVEWISPASTPQTSPQTVAGVEDGLALVKEDSYVAAFESDRSQSPSQDWQGQDEQPSPIRQGPDMGMSAEFLTQPASGVVDSQFPFSEDLGGSEDLGSQILDRKTIPESGFIEKPLLLPTIPESISSLSASPTAVPISMLESSIQPFSQPAVETQPLESLGEFQQGNKGNELSKSTPVTDNDRGSLGTAEQHLQGRGENELPIDSLLPSGDRRDLRFTEQERERLMISNDVSHLETQKDGSAVPEKPQVASPSSTASGFENGNGEQAQGGSGEPEFVPRTLKRVCCAEDMYGQRKLQRIEDSPVRTRIFPKTVMDVVRSRSRPLSDSLVDDECNILSMIMRTGVSFPPFVHEKRDRKSVV